MKRERSDNSQQLSIVDNYIKSERDIEPNPLLVSRLMSRIERIEISETDTEGLSKLQKSKDESAPVMRDNQIFFSALYRVAIAASVALILFLGVSLGTSYKGFNNNQISLNINDNQIENLHLYLVEE